jgi:hypothetical protein
MKGRILVWFSCGAASAVAAKLAVDKYRNDNLEIVLCDTLKHEHPDNERFIRDVEKWLGFPVKRLRTTNPRFLDEQGRPDIYQVFDSTGWLVGPQGARCTNELKRQVRRDYQEPDDVHIFGLTVDETMPLCKNPTKDRISRLERENPELFLEWNLRDNAITKDACYKIIKAAGIELPMMYRLGYTNNNCIGCVKGYAGYWNKIRRDFPETFARMAAQERKMRGGKGVSLVRISINGKPTRVFLDELPPDVGDYGNEPDIECGAQCVMPERVAA